jgi:cell wall-associated NlpC family hydrolase
MASAVNHTEGTAASRSTSSTTRMTRRLFGKRLAGASVAGAIAATAGLGAVREQVSAERMSVHNSATRTSGQAIADYAMQFHGYAYVWAGNSPATGFDCSGLTQYVVLNTVGIDIGHGTAGQLNYGRWVNWGEWLPGDLIYFAGTYGTGISHAGIYIGDGQMIHAANPGTGVIISSLYSGYYTNHYYGAIRVV